MIEKIADAFDVSLVDLSQFAGIPEHIHAYGTVQSFPTDELCWMSYVTPFGKISFSRNTSVFVPELASSVVDFLRNRFAFAPFFEERVHLIRTVGDVKPHRDEANRKSCINIGIMNSNSAKTIVYADEDIRAYKTVTCEDGDVYLLDTAKIHEVVSVDKTKERFLITYGFGAPFEKIIGAINGNSNP